VVNVILAYVAYRHYYVKRLRWWHLMIGALVGVSVVVYMNYLRAVGYMSNVTSDLINPSRSKTEKLFWLEVSHRR